MKGNLWSKSKSTLDPIREWLSRWERGQDTSSSRTGRSGNRQRIIANMVIRASKLKRKVSKLTRSLHGGCTSDCHRGSCRLYLPKVWRKVQKWRLKWRREESKWEEEDSCKQPFFSALGWRHSPCWSQFTAGTYMWKKMTNIRYVQVPYCLLIIKMVVVSSLR